MELLYASELISTKKEDRRWSTDRNREGGDGREEVQAETEKQTGIQAGRQTGRQTGRQKDRRHLSVCQKNCIRQC